MSGMADDAANKKDTTIRSITGGNSDSTYSHVLVDSTGKVIGYNLSSLGLSADDKLSLTDTTNNAAFKNNYKLVREPSSRSRRQRHRSKMPLRMQSAPIVQELLMSAPAH